MFLIPLLRPMALAGLSALCLLTACSDEQPIAAQAPATVVKTIGSDVSSDGIGAPFTLTGADGKDVARNDLLGKTVLLSFGYTSCPDICPTNLLTYAQSMSLLSPEQQDKVAVVFVSIDPERDTPARLTEYVHLFDPRFIGLSSSDPAVLNQVMQDYKVTATKVMRDDGDYVMDHSTGTYILDAAGQTRLYEPHGIAAEDLTHDLKTLLE
ncbi:MAG: SCO family protein [Neisseriaceae bacterium]|nr:SCO family protein [Neisseriaceae bacterium]